VNELAQDLVDRDRDGHCRQQAAGEDEAEGGLLPAEPLARERVGGERAERQVDEHDAERDEGRVPQPFRQDARLLRDGAAEQRPLLVRLRHLPREDVAVVVDRRRRRHERRRPLDQLRLGLEARADCERERPEDHDGEHDAREGEQRRVPPGTPAHVSASRRRTTRM
jgi:hypothetical protein